MLSTSYYTKYEPNWRPLRCFSRKNFNKNFYDWLTHAESMTKMMKNHSCFYQIHLLKQAWDRPFRSEREILKLSPRKLAMIREVEIHCDGYNVMFGRTIIPRKMLVGEQTKLKNLKNQSIGEVLFSKPGIQRSAFEVAKIYKGNYFHKNIGESFLWARRSIFYMNNKPLLLTEVFTPQFFEVFIK